MVAVIRCGNIETLLPAFTSARTVPGVSKISCFATLLRIVQMGAMRTLLLAKTSASQNAQMEILSFHATMAVAYSGQWPALLGLSPCVRTAVIWLTPFAMASVTLNTQHLRIRIGGLVPLGPRGVSSKHIAVMGIQIVTMLQN